MLSLEVIPVGYSRSYWILDRLYRYSPRSMIPVFPARSVARTQSLCQKSVWAGTVAVTVRFGLVRGMPELSDSAPFTPSVVQFTSISSVSLSTVYADHWISTLVTPPGSLTWKSAVRIPSVPE